MKSKSIPVAVLLIAVLMGTGCSRIEEAAKPKPKVVTREATVAAPAAAVEGTLPEGMPEVIPLWPGAAVAEGGSVSDGTVVVSFETADPYDDVLAGTSVGFERAGWSVAEGAEEASTTVLDVAGEGYEGFVTVSGSEGATKLDYLLSESVQ
jgi:hypothetical protein